MEGYITDHGIHDIQNKVYEIIMSSKLQGSQTEYITKTFDKIFYFNNT